MVEGSTRNYNNQKKLSKFDCQISLFYSFSYLFKTFFCLFERALFKYVLKTLVTIIFDCNSQKIFVLHYIYTSISISSKFNFIKYFQAFHRSAKGNLIILKRHQSRFVFWMNHDRRGSGDMSGPICII